MKPQSLQTAKDCERRLLRNQGFADSEFEIAECRLSESDHIHYVRIRKTPATRSNVLLMAHGYLSSNACFFKMYAVLKDDFHIVSFDLPGKGLSSSRPETPRSIGGWLAYFLTSIKRFCDELGLSRFSVCGHSLGAYLLTHFADAYPDMVQDLYLLSPAGVHFDNAEFRKRLHDTLAAKNFVARYLTRRIFDKVFVDKYAPFDIWFFGLFRSLCVRHSFRGLLQRLNPEEQRSIVLLYQLIFASQPSSDRCVGYLFKSGPMSDRPLMPLLERLSGSRRVLVLYGQWDWIDFPHTIRQIRRKGLPVEVDFVQNCDHQLSIQNPERTAYLMIDRKREWQSFRTSHRADGPTTESENDATGEGGQTRG